MLITTYALADSNWIWTLHLQPPMSEIQLEFCKLFGGSRLTHASYKFVCRLLFTFVTFSGEKVQSYIQYTKLAAIISMACSLLVVVFLSLSLSHRKSLSSSFFGSLMIHSRCKFNFSSSLHWKEKWNYISTAETRKMNYTSTYGTNFHVVYTM